LAKGQVFARYPQEQQGEGRTYGLHFKNINTELWNKVNLPALKGAACGALAAQREGDHRVQDNAEGYL